MRKTKKGEAGKEQEWEGETLQQGKKIEKGTSYEDKKEKETGMGSREPEAENKW